MLPDPRGWARACHGVLMLVGSVLLTVGCGEEPDDPPTTLLVSAASSLRLAFGDMVEPFRRATGLTVVFDFGSTQRLARQIEYGAPVDVFAAADVRDLDDLVRAGLLAGDSRRVFARGTLVLWTLRADLRLESVEDLDDPRVGRIAIAAPDRAPYGRAAAEVLEASGLRERLRETTVVGEDASRALQYARTGNVDVAFVPRSLAETEPGGMWVAVPSHLHAPLDHALAVVSSTRRPASARAFLDFVTGPQGRAILQAHGFDVPAGSRP